jgi:hypothetical protein
MNDDTNTPEMDSVPLHVEVHHRPNIPAIVDLLVASDVHLPHDHPLVDQHHSNGQKITPEQLSRLIDDERPSGTGTYYNPCGHRTNKTDAPGWSDPCWVCGAKFTGFWTWYEVLASRINQFFHGSTV